MLDLLPFFFLLVVLSVPIGWLFAGAAQRGLVRIPRAVVSTVNAIYVALVAAPVGFIALFALLVVRAWSVAGHAPVLGHLDEKHLFEWISTSPDPSDMPI